MKRLIGVYSAPRGHWVGDGFPVRSLFSYNTLGQDISPFLLLDFAGPHYFEPARTPRGVGQHPHRGFETVTIVLDGEVAHRDSTGAGGLIGPGDVQWMRAASGVVHEEYHSEEFAQWGGRFEVVQLWVNLPARDKMSPPRYQTLLDKDIPRVDLPHDAGLVRAVWLLAKSEMPLTLRLGGYHVVSPATVPLRGNSDRGKRLHVQVD